MLDIITILIIQRYGLSLFYLRALLQHNGTNYLRNLLINQTRKVEKSMVDSPDVLYTTTLGPTSNSTDGLFLRENNNENTIRQKRKANEYSKYSCSLG